MRSIVKVKPFKKNIMPFIVAIYARGQKDHGVVNQLCLSRLISAVSKEEAIKEAVKEYQKVKPGHTVKLTVAKEVVC